MKTNEFISKQFTNSIYNPSVWIKHPNNKYNLTLAFEMDFDTMKNNPDGRMYYAFFEEHPFDKLQVVSGLLKSDFKNVVEYLLKRLSEEVRKYYEA